MSSSQSQFDLYSNLDETTSIYFEAVRSETIVNETAQATIRRLNSNRIVKICCCFLLLMENRIQLI